MNERGFLPSTSIAVILLLRKLHLPHIRSLHTLSVRTQWCLRILYCCFEVEFYVALTRVCMPAGGSSFLQARNSYYTICYIPTPYCSSQELVGSPSLWLYSMSICDVRAEEKSRRRSRIYIEAHFQMHWEKRYGKHFSFNTTPSAAC